jgi:predicted TIM-barrel fold metal-dependent hydrolase
MAGSPGICVVDQDRHKHREKPFGMDTFEACDPAANDVAERVRLMDSLGLWAQIVYPNTAGLGGRFARQTDDDDLRLACVKIYNDAIAEWQRDSGERLLPMALLPGWDRAAMEKEIQRAVSELGLRGFVISGKPESEGLPNFMTDHWAPLWDFCSATGTPVNFHIGGDPEATSAILSWIWEEYGPESRMAVMTCLFTMANARHIANFCYSPLFDKYPGLKLVSVESGVGWLPYLLDVMEYQFDETMPNDGKKLQRRPAEYFREHFFATFWFEDFGSSPAVIERIGAKNVLIETDFPHPTCLFPHQEHLAAVASEWSPEVRQRILQDNGAELYKVKLPSTTSV